MRQSNLFEYLGDLEEALKQELLKETGSEDTTETVSDSEEVSTSQTPIEEMITRFIRRCASQARVPTKDEAEAIYILDTIDSKYRK